MRTDTWCVAGGLEIQYGGLETGSSYIFGCISDRSAIPSASITFSCSMYTSATLDVGRCIIIALAVIVNMILALGITLIRNIQLKLWLLPVCGCHIVIHCKCLQQRGACHCMGCPRIHRCSHWNFIAILYADQDICTSGLVAAILNFLYRPAQLDVGRCFIALSVLENMVWALGITLLRNIQPKL